MTREEKIEAYSMRLDGATIQEIADHFGVSRQYIYSIVPTPAEKKHNQAKKYSKYIYPNIVKYMQDNGVSCVDIARKSKVAYFTIQQFLSGKRGGSKKTIDAILSATGLTYEVAFAKQKESP